MDIGFFVGYDDTLVLLAFILFFNFYSFYMPNLTANAHTKMAHTRTTIRLFDPLWFNDDYKRPVGPIQTAGYGCRHYRQGRRNFDTKKIFLVVIHVNTTHNLMLIDGYRSALNLHTNKLNENSYLLSKKSLYFKTMQLNQNSFSIFYTLNYYNNNYEKKIG